LFLFLNGGWEGRDVVPRGKGLGNSRRKKTLGGRRGGGNFIRRGGWVWTVVTSRYRREVLTEGGGLPWKGPETR